MSLSVEAVAVAKKYTDNSIKGISGTLAGKNCTIKSIQKVDGVSTITFEWIADDGTVKTSTMNVVDGKDGKDGLNGKDGQQGADGSDGIGISKIEKISTVDLVDTYRITFTDNSTFDYEVTNGKDGQGGGTADVPIEKIKVNGELQTPVNKVVDITVPDAYDDTALSNRVKTIEDDYAKSSDIPSLNGYATETWVNEQGFLTQHQDLSNYATKDELPSLNGYATEDYVTEQISNIPSVDLTDYAKKNEIPTTVAELTDSADYAKKTDIPTTLPANGGNSDTVNNHTVETDVPTDAKFTDTVYDDTEVKKRISDNGYGEVAGGKNLLNHNIIDSKIINCSVLFKNDTFYVTNKGNYSHFILSVPTIVGKSYTVTIKDWSDYSYRCIASVSDLSDNTLVSMIITDATLSMTFTAVGTESLINISPNNTPNEMSNTITFKCMLEEGSVATEYEPYFPSNKMLAEETNNNSEDVNTLKKGTTVNLLKPTLRTTTQNGVTCTANGDGTYTLNGTNSSDTNAEFMLCGSSNLLELNKEFRLTGCPNNTYAYLFVGDWGIPWTLYGKDIGNGSNFKITTSSPDKRVAINVPKGVTVDNIVFKPMITTNLDATYDDFVPYTGDGETLASDVANLRGSLDKLVTYSTDEQIAGTYLDGKTIYRRSLEIQLDGELQKTFEFVYQGVTALEGGEDISIYINQITTAVNLSEWNIDTMVKVYGHITDYTDSTRTEKSVDLPYPVTYNSDAYVTGWYYYETKLYVVRVGEQYANKSTAFLTFEYTKI